MMVRPGSLSWLFRHELRLGWRTSWVGRGRRGRVIVLAVAAPVAQAMGLGIAFVLLRLGPGMMGAVLTLGCTLAGLAMLSQAVLAAIEALYARGDLDLLYSSPLRVGHVLALRMSSIAATIAPTWIGIAAALANGFVLLGHPGLLALYPAALALAILASAAAVAVTLTLLSLVGPRRTRAAANLVYAAVVVCTMLSSQVRVWLSAGAYSALAERAAAPPGWWLGRAASGEATPLLALLAVSLTAYGVTAMCLGHRFAVGTAIAAGVAPRRGGDRHPGNLRSGLSALLAKERRLMARQPGALFQTLIQLLGFLPLGFLLVRDGSSDLSGRIAASIVLMTSLLARAGIGVAVAYDTVGDLARTAPVRPHAIRRSKWLTAGAPALAVALIASAALMANSPRVAGITMAIAAISVCAELAAGTWSPARLVQTVAGRKLYPSAGTHIALVTGLLWSVTAVLASASSRWALVAGLVAVLLVIPLRPWRSPP